MNWIRVEDRLPTAADANIMNCVIVWHRYNGTMVFGWHQVEENQFITHWMPCPSVPPDFPEHYKKLWTPCRSEA